MQSFSTSLSSVQQYMNSIDERLLTPEEELMYAKQYQDNHDIKAKNMLIEHNTRLVMSIAKKYIHASSNFTFNDLIQEGNLGLMRAIEHYDYHKGYRLSTYATWWIKQGIERSIANTGQMIRVPVHVTEQYNRIKRLIIELKSDLGRKPLIEELVAETNYNPDEINYMLSIKQKPLSLEYQISMDNEGSSLSLKDYIKDEHADIETPLVEWSLHDELEKMLTTLPIMEAMVVKARFGMTRLGEKVTLGDTAKMLYDLGITDHCMTKERIRQIQRKALMQLNNESKRTDLKTYFEN